MLAQGSMNLAAPAPCSWVVQPEGVIVPEPPQINASPGSAARMPLSLGVVLVALNLAVFGMAWASVRQGRRHADEQAALHSGNLALVIGQNLV